MKKLGIITILSAIAIVVIGWICFKGVKVDATIVSLTYLEEMQSTADLAKAHEIKDSDQGVPQNLSLNLVSTDIIFIEQYEVVIEYIENGEKMIETFYVEKERFDQRLVGETFVYDSKLYSSFRLYKEK